METFLETLDMNNLRTMIENDSDYGDEVPAVSSLIVNDKMSQSATSILCSQSAKSPLKSPKLNKQATQ